MQGGVRAEGPAKAAIGSGKTKPEVDLPLVNAEDAPRMREARRET
jgi:hypothetical protein